MLTTIHKMKSSLAAGLFAALVIASTPAVAADVLVPAAAQQVVVPSVLTNQLTWGNAAMFTFFLGLVRLFTREGDTSPVRYDLSELAAGQNIANNLYYLVDDGVIGHFGKKPYLTVDTDNNRVEVQLADATDANGNTIKDAQGNKIKVSTACYPKGILGWTAYYIKPILGAMGTAAAVKILLDSLAEANATGQAFTTVVVNKFKYAKDNVLPKMGDAGTGPALNALGMIGSTVL